MRAERNVGRGLSTQTPIGGQEPPQGRAAEQTISDRPNDPGSESSMRSGTSPLYLFADGSDMRRAAATLVILVEQAFRRSDQHPELTPLDFAAMRYILQLDEEGALAAGITRTFNVTTATSGWLFKRLCDRDLISTELPPGKRRGQRARLTDAGRRALESAPLEMALAAFFAHLSSATCREIFDGLIHMDITQARWRELNLGVEYWR